MFPRKKRSEPLSGIPALPGYRSYSMTKPIGRSFMKAVINVCDSLVFGKLQKSKSPETAVDISYNLHLSVYEDHALGPDHVLRYICIQYCRRPVFRPYEICIEFSDIKHRKTEVGTSQTNSLALSCASSFQSRPKVTSAAPPKKLQQDMDQ